MILYTHNDKLVKINNKFVEKYTPDPMAPVQIGSRVWSGKNLAIDDGQGGIYTQTVNYGQGDVVEYYYTFDAAVRVARAVEGWHIPSDEEWTALGVSVGDYYTAGTKLKSTYGWSSGNGTDDYGFAAFPAGARYSSGFSEFGRYANFWTSVTVGSDDAYYCYFNTDSSMHLNFDSKSRGRSVRLIKDS